MDNLVSAKVIEKSVNNAGVMLTTFQLRYQRFFHSELMTHRVFSRSASSSRAIPVNKLLDNIKENPAMPSYWGKNKSGMQAEEQTNEPVVVDINALITDSVSHIAGSHRITDNLPNIPVVGMDAEDAWIMSSRLACSMAKSFSDSGYHKQVVNRITEPYQYINVIVTSTEWDNFFTLRNNKMAQPEFEFLANLIKTEQQKSEVQSVYNNAPIKLLDKDTYHHPYVSLEEFNNIGDVRKALMISASRCARVSYLKHDGTIPNIDEDLKLAHFLYNEGHFSPFEHQAQLLNISNHISKDIGDLKYLKHRGLTHIDVEGTLWSSNFRDFGQFRNFI